MPDGVFSESDDGDVGGNADVSELGNAEPKRVRFSPDGNIRALCRRKCCIPEDAPDFAGPTIPQFADSDFGIE